MKNYQVIYDEKVGKDPVVKRLAELGLKDIMQSKYTTAIFVKLPNMQSEEMSRLEEILKKDNLILKPQAEYSLPKGEGFPKKDINSEK
jgi:oligoribonuclease NrnB/cAMP/cGMP phosphodiesterase (DHH superfamily)